MPGIVPDDDLPDDLRGTQVPIYDLPDEAAEPLRENFRAGREARGPGEPRRGASRRKPRANLDSMFDNPNAGFPEREPPKLFEGDPEKTEYRDFEGIAALADQQQAGRSVPQPAAGPVSRQFRAAVEHSFDRGDEEARKNLTRRTDRVGTYAREVEDRYRDQDEAIAADPFRTVQTPTERMDPRVEKRAARLMEEGMQPDAARTLAQRAADFGVTPGAETTGEMRESDFDFERADRWATTPGLNNPFTRGAMQGIEMFFQGVSGTLGVLPGVDIDPEKVRQREQSLEEIGTGADALSRNMQGAVASIVQQAPFLGMGALGGGAKVTLGGIATVVFGQEYGEGRSAGLSHMEATTRAATMSAFEIIGESFGLGRWLDRIRDASKGIADPDELLQFLASQLSKEIPGELLTTTGQFATDMLPGIGLNPEATLADYLNQARDTVVQTVMQGGLMAAGTQGVAAVQSRDARNRANLAQESAMARWAEFGQNLGAGRQGAPETEFGGPSPSETSFPEAPQEGAVGRPVPPEDLPSDIAPIAPVAGQEEPPAPEMAPQEEPLGETVETLENNASGQTEASLEALSALEQQRPRFRVNVDSGERTPLPGLEGRDPRAQDGEIIVEEDPDSPSGFQIVDRGSTPAAHLEGVLARMKERDRGLTTHTIAGQQVTVNTSPTPAQKQAGNYQKGHIKFQGVDIAIENPKGSVRTFTRPDGKTGKRTMADDYGYVKRTEGADGDAVDVFIGPNLDAPVAYVIDQLTPDGKAFDEHKVVLGANSEEEAAELYLRNYQKGWKGLGAITPITMDRFKTWVAKGVQREPIAWVPEDKPDPKKPNVETDSLLDFIAKTKLHGAKGYGLSIEALEAEGLDPADMKAARGPGITRPFSKNGVASLDQMAEHLSQFGYPVTDENGNYSANKLLELITDELAGKKVYSAHREARFTPDQLREMKLEQFMETYEPPADLFDVPDATLDDYILKFKALQQYSSAAGDDVPFMRGPKQDDLFGDAVAIKNELQRLMAEKDRRRNTGQDDPDIGRPGDLFSQSANRQVDMEDSIASTLRATEPESGAETSTKAERSYTEGLTDAGEKIGGARKDQWADRGMNLSDLADMTDAEAAKLVSKSAVWKPDYAALIAGGMPVDVAGGVKILWDSLAAKPRANTPEGRVHYVSALRALREVLLEAKTLADIKAADKNFRTAIDYRDGYRLIENPGYTPYWSIQKGRRSTLYWGFDETQRLKKLLEAGFPETEAWTRMFKVRRGMHGPGMTDHAATIYLKRSSEAGTPLDPGLIRTEGFFEVVRKSGTTVGYAHTKVGAESLAKRMYEIEMAGRKSGEKLPERPHLDSITRTGPQVRTRDAQSEDFISDFSFRGIEFGNWAANDERQRLVNHAYDALMDLSEVLSIPPEALSLDGTLGLALGARGSGRARAHYETGKLVINMTKIKGAGALAHEWGHALDHYFGELERIDAYKTVARGASGWYRPPGPQTNANLRPEMKQAFRDLMGAIFQRDRTRAEAVRDLELKLEAETARHEQHQKRLEKELAAEQPNAKFVQEMTKWLSWHAETLQRGREQLARTLATEQEGIYGRTDTSFYKNAADLSGKSGKEGYWARPTEMFARAFEAYVFDKLQKLGRSSDYLVHGVEGTRYSKDRGFKGNPYPEGMERQTINEAFDRLFATMKIREGERSLALFHREQPKKAADFAKEIRQTFGIEFQLYESSNLKDTIKLDLLIVPKAERNRGVGSEVMRLLTRYADERGVRIILQTGERDPVHGTTSKARLKRFYKRFGFYENRGRNKDFTFTENMVRQPQTYTQSRFEVKERATYEGEATLAISERKRPKKLVSTPGQLDIFAPKEAPQVAKTIEQQLIKTTMVTTGQFSSGIAEVKDERDAAHILAPLRKMPQENMAALALDEKDRPIAILRHTIGVSDSAQVEAWALAGSLAAIPGIKSIYLAHNHPSGDPSPSSADENLTIRFARLLEDTGIKLNGHIILAAGNKNAYAFSPNGPYMTLPIRPARRRGTVPIMERGPIRFDPRLKDVPKITSPKDAIRVADSFKKTGLMLLNTRHAVVGFFPMTDAEMKKLRTGDVKTGAAAVLRALHEANANAVITVANDMNAARNMHAFFYFTGARSLDGTYLNEAGQRVSGEERGTLDARTYYIRARSAEVMPGAISMEALGGSMENIISMSRAGMDNAWMVMQWNGYSNQKGQTAHIANTITVPVDFLRGLKETRGNMEVMEETVADLTNSIRTNGYDNRYPILVTVAGDGSATIFDGNHRARAADRAGLKEVPIRVVYLNGGEKVEGRFNPDKLNSGTLQVRMAPQTATPEFKKWFKNSKVGDKDGNPLVVYHGGASNWTEAKGVGVAAWFAESSIAAHQFMGDGRRAGGKPRTGSNIMPAYLSIKNPLDLSKRYITSFTTRRELLARAGYTNEEMVAWAWEQEARAEEWRKANPQWFQGPVAHKIFGTHGVSAYPTDDNPDHFLDRSEQMWMLLDHPEIIDAFRAKGFDGIKAKEEMNLNEGWLEGRRHRRSGEFFTTSITWAPFAPTQIKSAIGNRGTYDPNEPNVLMSRALAPAALSDHALVQRDVQDIMRQYSIQPEISVVASFEDLPMRVYNRIGGPLAKASGAKAFMDFTPAGMTIYVISSEMRSKQHLAEVLAHEMTHFGLEAVVSNEEFEAIGDGILRDQKARVQEILKMEESAGRSLSLDNPKHRTLVVHEVLAYMNQKYQSGKPFDAVEEKLWDRVMRAIRAFLHRLGLTGPAYTEKYISDFLDTMTARMRSPRVQAGKGDIPGYVSMFNREAQPFYSAVERAVEGIKTNKASAQQWWNTIKNRPGVKPEELEWLGLEDWLNQQEGPVTRESVLDFIRANQIVLDEVVMGGDRKNPEQEKYDSLVVRMTALGYTPHISEDDGLKMLTRTSDGERFFYDLAQDRWVTDDNAPAEELSDEVIALAKEIKESNEALLDEYEDGVAENGTRHEKWTMPGGENYREILLTLPWKDTAEGLAKRKAVFDKYQPQIDSLRAERDQALASNGDWQALNIEAARLENQRDNEADAAYTLAADRQVFTHAHWDEPNVLLHVRVKDRLDKDGRKVLFVEEVQSDWHQTGRKHGYEEKVDTSGWSVVLVDGQYGVFDENQRLLGRVFQYDHRERRELSPQDAIREMSKKRRGAAVPRAPFKTSWPELAFKRVLRMAAEGGYDAIAWTTGDQQNKRYSLEKHISKVTLSDNSSGSGVIRARMEGPFEKGLLTVYDKKGVSIIGPKWLDREGIAEILGEELTDKLIALPGESVLQPGGGVRMRRLEGLDLKVGGDGQRGFYDRMLPTVANKLTSKWGGKVGEIRLARTAGSDMPRKSEIVDAIQGYVEGNSTLSELSEEVGVEVTEEDVESIPMDPYRAREQREHFSILADALIHRGKGQAGTKQHGLIITDAMRQAALQGLPLFHRETVDETRDGILKGGLSLEEDQWTSRAWNWLVFRAQDKFNDVLRLQEEAKKYRDDMAVPEKLDTYMRETLYHGRTEHRINQYDKEFVEPLLKMIKGSGYTYDQVEQFLYARHAPEANAHIKKITERHPELFGENETEWHSGMTDEQAAAKMEELRAAGDIKKLEAIGDHVDRMTKFRRDILVSEGLESAAAVGAWEAAYKHYVPLRGWADKPERGRHPPRGKGFDTGRKQDKRRTGRKTLAGNILATLVGQAQATIIMAEKAKVGRAFLDFAKTHPSDLYKVNEVEMERYFDEHSGLVKERPVFRGRQPEYLMKVMVDGKPQWIEFNEDDPQAIRMATAFKNLSAKEMNGLLTFMLGVNRFLSTINTSLNPEFVISNLFRDLQTAMINLNASDAKDLKLRILGDWRKAFSGIMGDEFQGSDSEWAGYFREFKAAGGKTGWVDFTTSPADLEKKLRAGLEADGTWNVVKGGLGAVMDSIEKVNLAVENAIRLSTFVNARRNGMSTDKAAELAKNLTINFNRKGDWGTELNALYLFYNAAAQGTAVLWNVMKNKTARRVLYGIGALAIANQIINRIVGGEDEDGENLYDKIPPWERSKNLIFMLPPAWRWKRDNGEVISYIKIPLPYGYNMVYHTGAMVGDVIDYNVIGNKRDFDVAGEAGRWISEFIGAFNPIGSSESLIQTVSPTIFDPAFALYENKNWYGGRIYPPASPFDVESPGSERYYKNASDLSILMAHTLNEMTGGSEVTPGVISIPPNAIDYVYEQATGGLGRFISNMGRTVGDLTLDPDKLQLTEVPFARRLVGEIGDRYVSDTYFERMREVAYYEKENKVLQQLEPGSKEHAKKRAYIDANYSIPEALRSDARAAEGRIERLKRERKALQQREGSMLERSRQERLKEIEQEIRQTMEKFNAQWNVLEDSRRTPTVSNDLIGSVMPMVNGKTKPEVVAAIRQSGRPAFARLIDAIPFRPRPELAALYQRELES